MRAFTRSLSLLLVASLLWLCGAVPVASEGTTLPASTRGEIGTRLEKAEGKRGTAGCAIIDLETGEVLYSRNADSTLIPASNMKLLTTVAALSELGADFEFVTRVLAHGRVSGGSLDGSLCILGGGDPNISGRFHDGDPLALFKAWAAAIKKQGITSVSGDLEYDSTLFGGEAYCEGWPTDEQYIKWYCAEVSALAFNDNCIGIRVLPATAGKPGRIELTPETAYVTVINETTTVAGKKGAEIGIVRPRDGNTITVKGKVYEQSTLGYFIDVAVHDPAAYAATVLKETLAREGVKVQGKIRPVTLTNEDAKQRTTLVEHRSTLAQALVPINTNSQNLHAEMLFRQLGLRYAGKGTFKTSRAAAQEFLAENGLWDDSLHIEDGSGLARDNRVSPMLLARLLRLAYKGPQFEAFRASLASAGESGTLEKRLTDKSLKGKVYAKTGYISGVHALSGYVMTDKRKLAFAMLMNDGQHTKQMQDEIVSLLVKAGD